MIEFGDHHPPRRQRRAVRRRHIQHRRPELAVPAIDVSFPRFARLAFFGASVNVGFGRKAEQLSNPVFLETTTGAESDGGFDVRRGDHDTA